VHYVIIGNSAAGINAIEAIRKVDPKGKITNISDEVYFPYSRPLLSYLIAGKVGEEDMGFRPPSFYQDYNVETVFGSPVVKVNSKEQEVLLSNGMKIPYDKLLVATGRVPGRLRIPGLYGNRTFHLLRLDDARGIIKVLPEVKRVVVIGSGLIGLKAAEALRTIGREVTVVEIMDRILPLATDERSSEILQSIMEENGIRFFLDNAVTEVHRDIKGNPVKVSLLKGGKDIPADLIIVAAGINPTFDFLSETQARVNVGVIVDHYLRTTDENIYAAGDVSESKDVITGRSNLSAVWPRACEQGYYAGFNMAGFKKEYLGGYGLNSVSFFGLSCITIGDILTEREDFEIILKEMPDERVYSKVILEDDRVRGAVVVGRVLNVSALNQLIRKRIDVRFFKDHLLEEKFVFAY